MYSEIIAAGKYLPEKRVLNDDLKEWMDTSDEWIRTRTGIEERRIATNENTSDLCIQAARSLLDTSNVTPDEIGFIIVATMTPDFQSPSVACLVQDAIGATNSYAFDLSAACSGFVYALSTAEKLLTGSDSSYGLVIGGETMSKVVDWDDRSTAVLFGDGAGAVLLKKTTSKRGILAESLHADGAGGRSLTCGYSPLKNPLATGGDESKQSYLTMDGKAIFDFAVRNVTKNMQETAEKANMTLDEVDLFILHQANKRIIKIIAKKLNLPLSKFASNIEKHGNTSAASIPILLTDCVNDQTLTLGSEQVVMMTGFGGGLTWGSILYKV